MKLKKHEVFQTQNTKEREQLWIDYEKLFSEIRRVFGIRHLTSCPLSPTHPLLLFHYCPPRLRVASLKLKRGA